MAEKEELEGPRTGSVGPTGPKPPGFSTSLTLGRLPGAPAAVFFHGNGEIVDTFRAGAIIQATGWKPKEPRDDLPPNTVVTVVQKGYTLNGRLLRPARVVVAQAPAEEKEADEGSRGPATFDALDLDGHRPVPGLRPDGDGARLDRRRQRDPERHKRGLRQLAGNLLKLYAERQLAEAPAMPVDTDLQRQFELAFEHDVLAVVCGLVVVEAVAHESVRLLVEVEVPGIFSHLLCVVDL